MHEAWSGHPKRFVAPDYWQENGTEVMMLNMASGAVRFRRGLPVVQVEVDGYKFFEVQRPEGDPFRLYEFEHHVALELNGQPAQEVVRAVQDKHGLKLTAEQVTSFAERLGELGLLEPAQTDDAAAPDATFDQAEALPTQPVRHNDNDDDLANEPTADHGRMALSLMAASMTAKQDDAVASAARASAWHEAEPTSLMGSMGDLLAVSRARTGESDVFAPEIEASPADTAQMESPNDAMGTREMQSVANQFDAPLAGVPQTPPSPLDELGANLGAPSPADELAANIGRDNQNATTRSPRRLWLWALVAVALAGAVGFAVFRFVLRPAEAPLSVDTLLPSPVAAYRWFETPGQLQAAQAATLAVPAGGKLVEVQEVGAKFAAGDTLAATEDAKRVRKDIEHLNERLAYYQQMLEAMTAEGNRSEARQAEIKLKEKQALLDDATREYAQVAIVASSDGVVGQQLAKLGEKVPPGQPVLALDAQQVRGVFQLSRDDAEQAHRLAFCRVLVDDKPFDCSFVSADNAETVVIELPADTQVDAGLPVYLARARFDSVFAVPASAVVQVGNTDRLFVAAPTGRAEVRAVALADRTDKEVLVAQGLDVGDAVIVQVPAALTANALIKVNARVLQ